MPITGQQVYAINEVHGGAWKEVHWVDKDPTLIPRRGMQYMTDAEIQASGLQVGQEVHVTLQGIFTLGSKG